jgi:hypothetical protein
MCEHDLAVGYANTWGGWGGSYGAGARVQLSGDMSVTVVNGNGANLGGSMDLTCYTPTAGTIIQGSVTIDGGGQMLFGRQYFNLTNEHWPVSFDWWTSLGKIAAGVHTVNCGVYVVAGTVTFDGNDGGTFIVREWP